MAGLVLAGECLLIAGFNLRVQHAIRTPSHHLQDIGIPCRMGQRDQPAAKRNHGIPRSLAGAPVAKFATIRANGHVGRGTLPADDAGTLSAVSADECPAVWPGVGGCHVCDWDGVACSCRRGLIRTGTASGTGDILALTPYFTATLVLDEIPHGADSYALLLGWIGVGVLSSLVVCHVRAAAAPVAFLTGDLGSGSHTQCRPGNRVELGEFLVLHRADGAGGSISRWLTDSIVHTLAYARASPRTAVRGASLLALLAAVWSDVGRLRHEPGARAEVVGQPRRDWRPGKEMALSSPAARCGMILARDGENTSGHGVLQRG